MLREGGHLLELVDPQLGSQYSEEEAIKVIYVALFCSDSLRALRPTMSEAVDMLEGRMDIEDIRKRQAYARVQPMNYARRTLTRGWMEHSKTRRVNNETLTESFVIKSSATSASTNDEPSRAPESSEPHIESLGAPTNDEPSRAPETNESPRNDEPVVTKLPRATMNDEPHTESNKTKLSSSSTKDDTYIESFVTKSVITRAPINNEPHSEPSAPKLSSSSTNDEPHTY